MEGIDLRKIKDESLDLIDVDFKAMVNKLVDKIGGIEDTEIRELLVSSICQHVAVHLAYHVNTRIDIKG